MLWNLFLDDCWRKGLILLGAGLLLNLASVNAANDLSPVSGQFLKVPLGCSWGDSPERLIELLHSGGLTREESEIVPPDKKIETIRGVIGVALKQNKFVYEKEGLVEIEYQYEDKNWTAQNYQDFFNNFRRMFDSKYGQGTQLIRREGLLDASGVTTSLLGYQWAQAGTILELFYYTAEQKGQIYRLISLHYKMP